MTNKITLSRELAERIEYLMRTEDIDPPCIRELRAALAEPTVGIDHETMRARYTDPEAVGLSSGTGSTLRVVVAEPVPPAGGEVEVLASITKLGGINYRQGAGPVELVDRVHVTRLQAEVELWKGRTTNICQAHADLQSELTKARELLRTAWPTPDWYKKRDAFLSNQSAPADKGQGEPKCRACHGTGVVDDGVITDCDGVPFENGPIKCVKDCPACSEQPAPVASK